MFSHNEQYAWDINTSGYAIDEAAGGMTAGGEDENWMKDEKGEYIAYWVGDGGGPWGRGSQVMGGSEGGSEKPTPLPHAVRLSYYDYGDDKFYRLDAVLPTEKIRQLISQKAFRSRVYPYLGEKPGLYQRYDTIQYGIGPKGYIVFWLSSLSGDVQDQVEIARYWAKERPGLTIDKWNRNGGDPNGRSFPLAERWFYVGHVVEPDTLTKLKAGWAPDPDYYIHAEIKYPWMLTMTGNVTLMSYQLIMANGEASHVYPWEMSRTISDPAWRALPQKIELFFIDKKGQWHRLRFNLYSQDRFGGLKTDEFDLTPISNAFKTVFPDIALDTGQDTVRKSDFARIEIHMNDDFKGFEVQLVKGSRRIDLPVGQDSIDFGDAAPYANVKDADPSPAEVEWNKYGPNGRL